MPASFASYFMSPTLSDVTIVIRSSDVDTRPPKRQRGHTLSSSEEQIPGHGIVLCAGSEVFKGELERWSGSGRPSVVLRVEPEQAQSARSLIYYLYKSCLPPAMEQQQLVHTLRVAEQYGAHECASACLDALTVLPPATIAWETVSLVLSLPPSVLDGPQLTQLVHKCSDKLHADLGCDLEWAANCPVARAQLLRLPLAALRLLLEDDRTAAASENTVLALVNDWLGHQPTDGGVASSSGGSSVGAEGRLALAQGVRMPQLEPLFLATVVPKMPWLLEILGPAGLAQAAAIVRGQGDPDADSVLQGSLGSNDLPRCWLQGPRPLPSPRVHTLLAPFPPAIVPGAPRGAGASQAVCFRGDVLCIYWEIELSEVQQLVEQAVARVRQQAKAEASGSGGGGGEADGVASGTMGVRVQPAGQRRCCEVAFAGHRWNMVLYLQHEKPATGGAGGAMRDATNTSSSAAAPSRAPKHGVSARGGGGGGGSGSGAAVSATANWVVRLAVEARPAMAVRGQTAVAFSGSLAARASPGSITAGRTGSTPSSQALAAGGGASGEGVVQPSGRQMRTPGGSQGRSSGLNLAAAAGGGAGSSGAAAGGAAEALAADQEVDAGGSGGGISWLERPLPQASHVKGRQCDHGYRDFFGVVLNARKGWEAGAWAGFVQPDGKLVLRCRVESVR